MQVKDRTLDFGNVTPSPGVSLSPLAQRSRFIRQQWIGTFTGPPNRSVVLWHSENGQDWRKVNEPLPETIERLDRVIANVRRYQ